MPTVVPIWHGRVNDDGTQIEFDEREQRQRKEYLRSLAGRHIECVIRRRRTQRSDRQNKFLHTVAFPIMAEHFGEDIETTKLLVLGECFGWKDVRTGYRMPMKPSTSQLTTEEASHLIEWMPPWALLNFRVHIPLPRKAEAS